MKMINRGLWVLTAIGFATAASAVCAGFVDLDAAASGIFLAETAAIADLRALEKAMKEAFNAMSGNVQGMTEKFKEMRERLQDVEQRLAYKPGPGALNGIGSPHEDIAQLIQASDAVKIFRNGQSPKVEIRIPRDTFSQAMFAAAITGDTTSTTGTTGQLVQPDRRPGIVAPAQRRFTIRDLFAKVPTKSNAVEFTKETAFTNNAGVQGAGSSPSGQYEGQTKGESGMTFSLEQVKVPTIAHWIPASRQILDDAPMLGQYINSRLLYGLKLEEEDQFLNGDGASGNVNGLVNQATDFAYGSTNLSKLDALAKSAMQLMLSDHEPSGFILNPLDWFDILLTKDNEGRYLLGNPAQMAEPRLWGLPVVATNSMSSGSFVALDAPRTGFVADREDAVVRISESHDKFFVQNMVAILCEERSTIVVERPAAIIRGSLNYAG